MDDIVTNNDLVKLFEHDPSIIYELTSKQLCDLLCCVGEHELIINVLAAKSVEELDG